MLADPKNPARWLDGSKRSLGHAFDLASRIYPTPFNLARINNSERCKVKAAAQVEKLRGEGRDMSVKALRGR